MPHNNLPFTIHPSPLTIRYPFTVIHDLCLPAGQAGLMEDGKCMVDSKWLMVNEASEGGV